MSYVGTVLILIFCESACLLPLSEGYCLYGDDPTCAFQCHCARARECGADSCPSGCAGAPLGHNWSGPGCQIGNVGLNKPANMTADRNYQRAYPATAALDGVAPGPITSACAHPLASIGQPAEWWADLGDLYNISSITVYGRTDCCSWRLEHFDLTVYNTSDNEALCAYQEDRIRTSMTIPCTTPILGRYVHFIRKDCSLCPSGVYCNSVIGCRQCAASYRPDCSQECEAGSWGINCNQTCGRCEEAGECDKDTGVCTGDCQLWWTNDRCTTYIALPEISIESANSSDISDSSIDIRWQHLLNISSDITRFYGYSIGYFKHDEGNATYVKSGIVSYEEEPRWLVNKLEYNTMYQVQVRPYRQHGDVREYGDSYPDVIVKTNCIPPAKPQITDVIVEESETAGSNITVMFQSIDRVEPNCYEITNASLEYKLSTARDYTVYEIELTDTMYEIYVDMVGEYDIRLVVMNDEGYETSSVTHTAYVREEEAEAIYSTQTVIIGSCVSAAVIICCVVVILLIIRQRRQRSQNKDRAGYDNMSFNVREAKDTGEGVKDECGEHEPICQTAVYAEVSAVNNFITSEANYVNDVSPGQKYVVLPDTDDELDQESQKVVVVDSDTDDSVDQKVVTDSDMEEEPEPDDIAAEESLYANSGVTILNFEGYVAHRKANIQELHDEYRTLPEEDLSRCVTASLPSNREKNRFRNIYAYDDTRVILDSDNKEEYFNANYITGYNRRREYIATQGTKKNTWVDFWRMIWHEKANRIVMVANVDENGKRRIDPYWPEHTGESFSIGGFHVTTESVETTADYKMRIMALTREKETRIVRQFHFTSWEDKNKPVYGAMSLLAFCKKVHSFDQFSKGPLIVHCSAGVGRTGTFIALDILMQMAVTEESLDIYNCVKRLRNERMHMVQTKEQYVFLHDVLVEFIKMRNKSYDCHVFRQTFMTVCDETPSEELMKVISAEFQLVCDLKNPLETGSRDGTKPQNVNKNRNMDLVPGDQNRLYISGRRGSNYINAVAVDSFKAHDSYIVTQMPLAHTVADMWQLVMEQRCQAIVMLNDITPDDLTSVPYWPDDVNTIQTHGQVTVQLLSVDDRLKDSIIIRDLRISESADNDYADPEVFTVRHFQLLSWPRSSDVPHDRGDILDLLEMLQSWQQLQQVSSYRWKTLVHCLDGGRASGMFCGASYMLDRMRVEQDVNALLAVRYVARRRPQFFTKLIEYKFLYEMAFECLTKDNQYANLQ